MLKQVKKGNFHLNNALRLNFANHTFFKENFPTIWEKKSVQNQIIKYRE